MLSTYAMNIFNEDKRVFCAVRMKGVNNSNWDFEKLKVILQKNEYPPKLIDKSVNRYLNKKIMNKPTETTK